MSSRPYSPETLGARWGCSAEKVRRMYHDGELAGFRLGKLIRISAAEVERIECQASTESASTGASSSSLTSATEDGFVSRLARMTGESPKLELPKSGASEPRQQVSG